MLILELDFITGEHKLIHMGERVMTFLKNVLTAVTVMSIFLTPFLSIGKKTRKYEL